MEDCLVSKAKSMFGEAANRLGITAGYTIRTESLIAPMDKVSGQIIELCRVDGCSTELEVYPDTHTPGIYHVTGESLQAARLVCKLVKERE